MTQRPQAVSLILSRLFCDVLPLIVGIVVISAVLDAQNGSAHRHHMAPPANAEASPTAVSVLKIPDVTLLDQHGKKVHFYTDLIKGKVVAINTIFTTCTTICPLMGANFSKLRKILENDAAGKVRLISISIDPIVDTPERLEQWSKNFGPVEPGWTLLTGSKEDVDSLLKALQVFTSEKQDHAPVVLIGDSSGNWSRASALLPPSHLAELIHSRLGLMANHTLPGL